MLVPWVPWRVNLKSFITDDPCPAFFTLPIPFAGLAACRRGLVPYVGGVDGKGPEATSTTQDAGRMGWDGILLLIGSYRSHRIG